MKQDCFHRAIGQSAAQLLTFLPYRQIKRLVSPPTLRHRECYTGSHFSLWRNIMNIQSSYLGTAFLLLVTVGFLTIFSLETLVPSLAQNSEEREIEDKIPKHVPIKVKIKSEKEKSFRDLKNAKWVRDFELEVTNTSDKPVYFLELWVVLPEVIAENGMELGFPPRYGRSDFIKFKTLALPEDIAIQPGEQYVFQI